MDTVVAATRARSPSARALVVAIDGRSGSGKSTLSEGIVRAIDAVIVPCDDFYAAGVSSAEWGRRTPEHRAAEGIDWRRLKREAIEPLRTGSPARWYAFDFFASRADGTYPLRIIPTERVPKRVVVLDGAYSARPELHDVLDLTVLVQANELTRQARLQTREAPDFLPQWHARWDAAEEFYFAHVQPPSSFDLVVQTDDAAA